MPPATSADGIKIRRACDACRKKKTRCDGPKQANNICTNCRGSSKPCTYQEASTPRGPPKAYVTALEDRLEQLENLLHQMRPDADFSSELGPPVIRGSWKEDGSRASASARRRQQSPPHTSLRFSSHLALNSHWRHDSDSDDSDEFDSSDSENMVEFIRGDLRKLTATHDLESNGNEPLDEITSRFHGKSSLVGLIDLTKRYKELSIENDDVPQSFQDHYTRKRRPEFWAPLPWESQWAGLSGGDEQEFLASVIKEFPPESLAADLIQIYFTNTNSQLPLLHRPTFERQYREKLHHRHRWFACLCMSLFAVASRWCNDPSVLPRNCKRISTGAFDWTLAGSHYYSVAMQIHQRRRSPLYPACLEEVQTFSLLGCYLRGTASPSAAWICVSIGLRKAQDVGAHRKKVYSDQPNVEEELWKRAVWCLIAYDRFGGATLGRPSALEEEEFDLDPCLEVDDEYWEADPPFQQPATVPCRVTYFNSWLRLSQIVTFTVKTIFSIHNPRALLGRIAKVRTDEVIAQLTMAMQDWLHSVPDYLRWSPHIQNEEFANQSASLTTTYYLAEMLIYRAFIPPIHVPGAKTSPPPMQHLSSTIPALTYCINAARACARIVEVQCARSSGWRNVPTMIAVAQLATAILTLGVWDAKTQHSQPQSFEDVKPLPAHDVGVLMGDIGVFLGTLEAVQWRWETARDMVPALKAALPKEEPQTTQASSEPLPATMLHTFTNDQGAWTMPPQPRSSYGTPSWDSAPTYTDYHPRSYQS